MKWTKITNLRGEFRPTCLKVADSKVPVGIDRSGERLAMIIATENYAGNLRDLPEVSAEFAKNNLSFLCMSAVQGRNLIIASSKFRVVVTRAPNFENEVMDACVAKWRSAESAMQSNNLLPALIEVKTLITSLSTDLRSAAGNAQSSTKEMERRISELEAELNALKGRKKPGPKPKGASGLADAADGGR